jgi:hypothetical protein
LAVIGLSQALVGTTGGESIVYLYGHDLLAQESSSVWDTNRIVKHTSA